MVSLNLGLPRPLLTPGKGEVLSGIVKAAVVGRRRVFPHNIEGDGQADLRVHGGERKAVYCYPHEHYAYWADELGRSDLAPGQFGENLTVEGLLESVVRVGDRWRVGTALLEVTQARSPCFKLAAHMGRPDFPRLFLKSGRSGWYCRIIEPGDVGAGDDLVLEARGDGPTVLEAARGYEG